MFIVPPKMISTFVSTQILRNTANKTPTFLFRGKSFEATNEPMTSENSDMPVAIENPYVKERRLCVLCKYKIDPDYKNVRLLSQFQSRFTGRIYGKHITGLCAHKQKKVELEIIKAQNAGLMGYMTKEPTYVNDPQLFNPDYPFRPHKY